MPPGGDCNATPALRIQNYLQRRKRMTFEIHSNITNRSMTVAARAMRRVLRRKRSIIWAIFGWSVFLFNALLLIPFDGEPFALDVRTVTSPDSFVKICKIIHSSRLKTSVRTLKSVYLPHNLKEIP